MARKVKTIAQIRKAHKKHTQQMVLAMKQFAGVGAARKVTKRNGACSVKEREKRLKKQKKAGCV